MPFTRTAGDPDTDAGGEKQTAGDGCLDFVSELFLGRRAVTEINSKLSRLHRRITRELRIMTVNAVGMSSRNLELRRSGLL